MKPKVFIGSSVEGLKFAYAIQENLEYDALCTPWTQGVFALSGNTLENLIQALDKFDFAIFILTPDDVVMMRDKKLPTVRDNVIFELGLFIGKLGKEKVFFLVPRGNDQLHLPTDLAGITPGKYDDSVLNDLRSALGPFCNKVRIQMAQQQVKNQKIEEEIILTEHEVKSIDISTSNDTKTEFKKDIPLLDFEYGVSGDEFGNTRIHISSCDFFQNRLARAFPGTRDLRIFDDPEFCAKRLLLLLRAPLKFENGEERGTVRPIWWFRDGSNMYIENATQLTATKILMNHDELNLKRIAVYHSSAYYLSFVYIELNPDQQTGIYEIPTDKLVEYTLRGKYYTEEYAIYQGVNISREEYDDGAAEIKGEVVDVYGAELRRRFLTPHNFIICGNDSPINSNKFDSESQVIFNGILTGSHKIEDLEKLVSSLTKDDYYR